MPITTVNELAPAVAIAYQERLLAVPTPYMIHSMTADKRKLAKGSGDTVRMVRFNPLDTAMVPLGRTGMTPPAQLISNINIDAQISFYGTWVYINEQVILTTQCPVLNETTRRLAVSMRQTEDQLVAQMLAATAGAVNCTNGNNGDWPTEINDDDAIAVGQALADASAKTILDNIEGEDRFGTAPIRDSYFALGSTKLQGSLEACNGFTHKNKYASQISILRSEYGALWALRMFLSPIGWSEGKVSNLHRDVYDVFCLGAEAHAIIDLDEYNTSIIYRPGIYNDPLAQNQSLGYKFAFATRVLNDLWALKLRCTLKV